MHYQSVKGNKGPSTELMPGILSALDQILDKSTDEEPSRGTRKPLGSPRKVNKSNNFQLSFNVQKILSNVTTVEEVDRKSDDNDLKENTSVINSRRSPEKAVYKSNESLELLPSVQKMLSNLPDTDLVILTSDKKVNRSVTTCEQNTTYPDKGCESTPVENCAALLNNVTSSEGADNQIVVIDAAPPSKPLGNYKHTSVSGIASRTPTGRKNMGKYLQVPSESSVGTCSTTSSEVSRPVSLTSLGSCSSSESSCALQPGSAYQASEESLDSDPESSRIQGSADSGIADDICSSINKREYDVVAEITDTEAKYVDDLYKVIQDYLLPWKSDPDCVLNQHIPALFNNLEDIYNFNKSFLDELRNAKLNPSATATLFINNSGFSIYTDYCTNYPKTISVLTQLMGHKESAEHFKAVQIYKQHDLPLGSYLLKPVQRILRYRMLLERLSERCDSRHKPVVDLALRSMTGVASHINNMKRKYEIEIRIQEIQSQLYGWSGPDLTTLGELIAEGTFRMGTRKGRRHVFLFDKLLLFTKCRPDGNFSYKSHIMCSNLMLVEQVRGEPLSFHVLPFDNPRDQVTLRAKSLQHKREWSGQLKRVIIENYNAAIPNHAQKLLMQLGQDLPEKEESSEMWIPLKKQYSTPQYLERRSRIRQSRELGSRRAASHDRSFPSLTNWRRKSEPNVQQYDNKTVPSRISKLKKAKESTSTFYTDLSDSETYENSDIPIEVAEDAVRYDMITCKKNLESISTKNEETNKAINCNCQTQLLKESETDPNIYIKTEAPITSKADSLPRSFQLNDQVYNDEGDQNESDTHLKNNELVFSISQLDNSNHPEHKIYRKSSIRFSLMQKYHAIRDRPRKPNTKQNSKVIGERIANRDYENPQKLFNSMNSLNHCIVDVVSNKKNYEYIDFEGPEALDMTISEHEVLTELHRRLKEENTIKGHEEPEERSIIPSSQSTCELYTYLNSGQVHVNTNFDTLNSSHTCIDDSYYESLLEKSLNDDNVERCDSFRKSVSSGKPQVNAIQTVLSSNTTVTETCYSQIPIKEPPPIPAKPARASNKKDIQRSSYVNHSSSESENSSSVTTIVSSNSNNSTVDTLAKIKSVKTVFAVDSNKLNGVEKNNRSQGWVKTVIGRFE